MKKQIYSIGIIISLLSCFASCQQEDPEAEEVITYSNDIYELKTYKAERHPPVVRNGFGMDIYHQGNSSLDTLYFSYTKLPAWHPNNLISTGVDVKKFNTSSGDSAIFQYDLLFYNEFAYTPLTTGDYSASGYPVIFLYTDPTNDNNSTKAVMVGQGIDRFTAFTADSIDKYKGNLKGDPLIDLASYRTEVHTATVNGKILIEDTAEALFKTMTIGNKFRPNIGGIFTMNDVSDVAQINYQPVFLIKTREGLYAKFIVTRFKGVGVDVQKMTLQWQALKK